MSITPSRGRLAIALGIALLLVWPATATASGTIQVVAAENFWGSIAAQVGGAHVHVTSVITNPATDPHSYEPTAADARTIAGAQLLIENGIGYDPWASQIAAANGQHNVLDVGTITGVKAGGNPHRWYSPANVNQVIAAISSEYTKLDPHDASYFQEQETAFERKGLAEYHRLIATIRAKYKGVKVGASESIFAPLAQALGLDLVTPYSFLKAISEGTEPTAGDKTTIDRQIATHEVKVWVFNSQNSTPDVARITDAARSRHIPVTTITETLAPASASFQQWQVAQLRALAAALRLASRN